MEREILFRGKMKYANGDIQKGSWVYGDFINFKDGKNTLPSIYGFGEIVPETVGQYTGLTDKNGVKIFEGDIVKVVDRGQTTICGYPEQLPDLVLEVAWYEENAQFRLISRVERYVNDFHRYTVNQFEVIGNIHDNPELLKGGTE